MIAAYFYMFYKPLQGISDFYGLFKEFFHSDFLEKMKGINFNGWLIGLKKRKKNLCSISI